MSTLLLIRHGQASFGSADYDRLSDDGREQVARLRAHLHALDRPLDGLWCGSLRRQRDTAAILAEGSALQPRVDPAFDEYRAEPLIRGWLVQQPRGSVDPAVLAVPQSVSSREYQRMLEAAGRAWIRGEIDDAAHERWPEFRARVARGLQSMMEDAGRGRRIALCTSAGVIGAAVGHVLGLEDHQALALSWSLHNASLSVVLFDRERASLASFNGVPHLEQPGLEALITYR